MKITTAPLSKEEVKSLQQQTYLVYGVFLIVLLGFLILIYHIYQEVSIENQSWLQFEFKRLVALPLVFVTIFILRRSIAMKNSLKNGQKEILSGILTKKEKIPRPFGNQPDYYICIDEQEIVITDGQIPTEDAQSFYNAEIGQKIIIERTIKSQLILKIEVLKTIK